MGGVELGEDGFIAAVEIQAIEFRRLGFVVAGADEVFSGEAEVSHLVGTAGNLNDIFAVRGYTVDVVGAAVNCREVNPFSIRRPGRRG